MRRRIALPVDQVDEWLKADRAGVLDLARIGDALDLGERDRPGAAKNLLGYEHERIEVITQRRRIGAPLITEVMAASAPRDP